ncbi:MAG TPA: hypothetical protein VMY42_03605, partial [Thermoguttaceae bacterium]|nr:hypothetical protein [Thermoguttaceae bacterium]
MWIPNSFGKRNKTRRSSTAGNAKHFPARRTRRARFELLEGRRLLSDVLNLIGNGDPVTVNLLDLPTVTGGGLGTVTLSNVEIVNLNANGGAVTVNGTAGDDAIEYAPTGPNAAAVQRADLNIVFQLGGVAGLTL